MAKEFIFAGFGGQGVLLIGQLVAYAAMLSGKHVTWMPSYGPEMRGGTANCSVVISDDEVGCPIVGEPDAVLVMNNPSLEKFEQALKPGGILVINSSLVTIKPTRTDIKIIEVPASKLEEELGILKAMNIIMLGAFVEATGVIDTATMFVAFSKKFAARPHTIEPNKIAFKQGASLL